MRIGHGIDTHCFAKGRRLILGGVEIPYYEGLLGHSDADCLIHALMDSLLGALGLGDIGRHFPDDDDEYKDIASTILLERVADMMHAQRYTLINADMTIVAQAPRLSPYIADMRANIAAILDVSPLCINIKATTTEKMGYIGRGEGISAHSVCLLRKY